MKNILDLDLINTFSIIEKDFSDDIKHNLHK